MVPSVDRVCAIAEGGASAPRVVAPSAVVSATAAAMRPPRAMSRSPMSMSHPRGEPGWWPSPRARRRALARPTGSTRGRSWVLRSPPRSIRRPDLGAPRHLPAPVPRWGPSRPGRGRAGSERRGRDGRERPGTCRTDRSRADRHPADRRSGPAETEGHGYHDPMPSTVLLASPRGYCAGVERAVEAVEAALERYGAPVHVRKQIVHNAHVVRDLEAKGAVFVDSETDAPDGSVLVLSAHGVAPEVYATSRARGLTTLGATCPLVTKVHLEAL